MNRLKLLADAAKVLASEPDQQLKYLVEIGAAENVDELALAFDDIAGAAKDMRVTGELSLEQYEATKAINEFLLRMSGSKHQELWTIESLSSGPEWHEVRGLAKRLLNLIVRR
jgi:hypothetical protein